jgi:hypothetical protein
MSARPGDRRPDDDAHARARTTPPHTLRRWPLPQTRSDAVDALVARLDAGDAAAAEDFASRLGRRPGLRALHVRLAGRGPARRGPPAQPDRRPARPGRHRARPHRLDRPARPHPAPAEQLAGQLPVRASAARRRAHPARRTGRGEPPGARDGRPHRSLGARTHALQAGPCHRRARGPGVRGRAGSGRARPVALARGPRRGGAPRGPGEPDDGSGAGTVAVVRPARRRRLPGRPARRRRSLARPVPPRTGAGGSSIRGRRPARAPAVPRLRRTAPARAGLLGRRPRDRRAPALGPAPRRRARRTPMDRGRPELRRVVRAARGDPAPGRRAGGDRAVALPVVADPDRSLDRGGRLVRGAGTGGRRSPGSARVRRPGLGRGRTLPVRRGRARRARRAHRPPPSSRRARRPPVAVEPARPGPGRDRGHVSRLCTTPPPTRSGGRRRRGDREAPTLRSPGPPSGRARAPRTRPPS